MLWRLSPARIRASLPRRTGRDAKYSSNINTTINNNKSKLVHFHNQTYSTVHWHSYNCDRRIYLSTNAQKNWSYMYNHCTILCTAQQLLYVDSVFLSYYSMLLLYIHLWVGKIQFFLYFMYKIGFVTQWKNRKLYSTTYIASLRCFEVKQWKVSDDVKSLSHRIEQG